MFFLSYNLSQQPGILVNCPFLQQGIPCVPLFWFACMCKTALCVFFFKISTHSSCRSWSHRVGLVSSFISSLTKRTKSAESSSNVKALLPDRMVRWSFNIFDLIYMVVIYAQYIAHPLFLHGQHQSENICFCGPVHIKKDYGKNTMSTKSPNKYQNSV